MKKIICTLLFAAMLFFFSPWLAIFLPAKAMKHTYREIGYQRVAEIHTSSHDSDRINTLSLVRYLYENLYVSVHPETHTGKAFAHLRDGAAYCDYQSNLLGALLAKIGVRGRYVMLFNDQGISNHTIAEVFLDGEWRFIDPLFGLYAFKKDGSLATLSDIATHPSLLYEHERAVQLKQSNPQQYQAWKLSYERMIDGKRNRPVARSKPKLDREHIFDKLTSLHIKIFGRLYYQPFLEAYLKKRERKFKGSQDEWLYFKARSYHLYGLHKKAKNTYTKLHDIHDKKIEQRARFYEALLYYFDFQDYKTAIRILSHMNASFPKSQIQHASNYYLGRTYEKMGQYRQAITAYEKVPADLMTDAANRLASKMFD